jgi:hypothetical protein
VNGRSGDAPSEPDERAAHRPHRQTAQRHRDRHHCAEDTAPRAFLADGSNSSNGALRSTIGANLSARSYHLLRIAGGGVVLIRSTASATASVQRAACLVMQQLNSVRLSATEAIRTVGRSASHIRDGHDPRPDRDHVSRQSVRVPAAVQSLMMLARDDGARRRIRGYDLGSYDWMRRMISHSSLSAPTASQNAFGHTDLAEVMK